MSATDNEQEILSSSSLAGRIEAAGARAGRRSASSLPDSESASYTLVKVAWHVGIELIVAVGFCLMLGWLVDRWLLSQPWGMIGFFFLGVGAGLRNVYRLIAQPELTRSRVGLRVASD